MNNPTLLATAKTRTKNIGALLVSSFSLAMIQTASAQGDLSWSEASSSGDDISVWLRNVIVAVMAIFIMISIILGSLAFKQLSADGNWKDFWSKIAGAIGMFVVPVAVYWALDL